MGEVTMDTNDFGEARNIQALAKIAINSSVREILHSAQEWSFTLSTVTQTLTVGTGVYSFPADTSSVDWDSFYLKKLDATNNMGKRLKPISYVDYLDKCRPVEESSGEGGRTTPENVYQTQDLKFGVTPLPNAAYQVEYKYWIFPQDLTEANNNCVIPSRFDSTIIDGAMVYMLMYRSNEQGANIYRVKFEEGVKTMRRLLQDEPIEVRSTLKIYPQPTTRTFF
jgi:hypothetical protein